MTLSWSWSYLWSILPTLLAGLKLTVEASVLATPIALVLGLCFAVMRKSEVRIVTAIAVVIIEVIRGTPFLVQLYFAFYVLPKYGVTASALTTGIVVLGVNYSGYTAEVYRAGLEGVPSSQTDAAIVLGFSARDRWARIIFPQAIRKVIPPLGSYVLSMFKESALLSAITVNELLNSALGVGSLTFRYLEPITAAGAMYLIISYPLARLVRWLDRYLQRNTWPAATR